VIFECFCENETHLSHIAPGIDCTETESGHILVRSGPTQNFFPTLKSRTCAAYFWI